MAEVHEEAIRYTFQGGRLTYQTMLAFVHFGMKRLDHYQAKIVKNGGELSDKQFRAVQRQGQTTKTELTEFLNEPVNVQRMKELFAEYKIPFRITDLPAGQQAIEYSYSQAPDVQAGLTQIRDEMLQKPRRFIRKVPLMQERIQQAKETTKLHTEAKKTQKVLKPKVSQTLEKGL